MDSNETFLGSVKWWNDGLGYGFIELESGVEVFVHHSEIQGSGIKNLAEGQALEFQLEDTPKGTKATNVHIVGVSTNGR